MKFIEKWEGVGDVTCGVMVLGFFPLVAASGPSRAGGFNKGATFGSGCLLLVLAPDLVREPAEDHGHASPLLRRQRVPVPNGRDQNADELACRGDGGVGQGAEAADGEEDEVLPHGAAQAEQEDVPGCVGVLEAESHGVVPTPTRHQEHEQSHVRRAPQVHPHHQVPCVHLRIPAATALHTLFSYVLIGMASIFPVYCANIRREQIDSHARMEEPGGEGILCGVREAVQSKVEQTESITQRCVWTGDLAWCTRALQNRPATELANHQFKLTWNCAPY